LPLPAHNLSLELTVLNEPHNPPITGITIQSPQWCSVAANTSHTMLAILFLGTRRPAPEAAPET
jgi:hypothetical protein